MNASWKTFNFQVRRLDQGLHATETSVMAESGQATSVVEVVQ